MGTLKETSRKPSYMKDIERYGSNGEKLFLDLEGDKFKEKNYVVFDVTKDKDYQFNDIDFVISKNPNVNELPSVDSVLSDKDFEKVEIKVDTRALRTGNLPYEFISHGSSGWSVITKSNYVYMILCSEEGDNVVARRILWIDMAKWSDLAKNRRIPKKINYIENESIVDLLCKISDMRDNGVIIAEKEVLINI